MTGFWIVLLSMALCMGLIWSAKREGRRDRVGEPNENIMQTRQDIRLIRWLLIWIGFLLTIMLALLVDKLVQH